MKNKSIPTSREIPVFATGISDTCTNITTKAFYVGRHEISGDDFDKWKNDFFQGATIGNKIFSAADIPTSTRCDEKCLQFTFYYDDKTTNAITVDLIDIPAKVKSGGKPKGPTQKYYSLKLFDGIKELFNPTRFEFSKAKIDGNPGLVYKAIREESGHIVYTYFGDLSSSFPVTDPIKITF